MDRVTYRQHKIYVNYSIQNDNDWYKKKLDHHNVKLEHTK